MTIARVVVIVSGCLAAAACDGDAQQAGSAVQPLRSVSGNATKGPLDGAEVRAYRIDDGGRRLGDPLATTLTAPDGSWSLALPAEADLLIESRGGRYVDEADPQPQPGDRRSVTLQPDDTLTVLLPAGETRVSINPYTDALLRQSRFETDGADFPLVFRRNRDEFEAAFGFDIVGTLPADPVRPAASASTAARQYAMALGAAAQLVNAAAIAGGLSEPDFTVIAAVIDDLADCRADGIGLSATPVPFVASPLGLNGEILRFRNNNFAAYETTPLLQVDSAACRVAAPPDVTPPVLAGLPGNLTVESADGAPVSSADPRIRDRLSAVTANDDRDGTVAVVSDLPDELPVGVTTVRYDAVDVAGNATTATLTITVVLPQVPDIVAPPDIVARLTAELTRVELGDPVVSDNVSAAAALQVTSNAPANGFPRGEFLVIWRVVDEAGLVGEAVQQVNVGTLPGYPGEEFGTGQTGLPTFPGTPPFGPPDATDTGTPVYLQPGEHPERSLRFPHATVEEPAVIELLPGLHSGTLLLTAPCDHVVMRAGDSAVRLSGTHRPALVISGCRNVRLEGLTVEHSAAGGLLLSHAQVSIRDSLFTANRAVRGAAMHVLDAEVRIERTLFADNAATGFGGAIWIGSDSKVTIVDSVLRNNFAIPDPYRDGRLILDNVRTDAAAIAMDRAHAPIMSGPVPAHTIPATQ